MQNFVALSFGAPILLISELHTPGYAVLYKLNLFSHLGFHLGRPSRTSMEDVTVGKPHGQHSQLSQYRWAPYETQNRGNETTGLLDCTEAVSQQLVSLCELMVPCGYIL